MNVLLEEVDVFLIFSQRADVWWGDAWGGAASVVPVVTPVNMHKVSGL